MSHDVLQHVVVRMHYDADFRAHVFSQPDVALGGLALSATERRWLLASDPRAYATDPHLQSRTLQTLIEEYPASTLLLGVAPLWGFFGSPAFHHVVASRGRMALVFRQWLVDCGGGAEPAGAVAGVAGIEYAIAVARRGGAGFAAVGDQAMVHYTQAREVLMTSETPVHDLIRGGLAAPSLAAGSTETDYLLAQRDRRTGEIGLSTIGAPLFAVLEASRRGLDPRATAMEQGATESEADELVIELRTEGLLPENAP